MKKPGMIIKTFDPGKGREVRAGVYDGLVFTKTVTGKHYMRIYNGYGIQEDVIQKLISLGCERIIIRTPNDGNYYSLIDSWLKSEPKQYGNGKQRFLSVDRMVNK